MEFYQLRSFATVAEVGHLTRAAERLHVSQPALSAQIRALEDQLGVTLFDRGSAGMSLTRAGQRLLPAVREIVAKASALRGLAQSLQGEVVGRLKVGTLADPEVLRLGEVLAHAREQHSLLAIELHHEVSGAAFAKVRDGELDASFYYGPLVHANIATLPLATLAYRVAAPSGWRSQVDNADDAAIAALPWIVTPPVSTHHALVSHFFEARGLAPATVVEADNELVIRSLVVSGVGVALLREDLALAAEARGEVVIWPPARIETTLQFIWPAARASEPPLAALVALIEDAWRAPTPAPGE
ncbi:MAG TPA: LysR family transcriptional regulator [Casimicrobiaceae bacterium]|nr:LysR family transcriptional regulator [Casimicrobiaceae bacterium]